MGRTCAPSRTKATLLSQKVLERSTDSATAYIQIWHHEADILQLGEEKYKSPASRAAEEAADRIEPPVLPEYLRGDDGLSGNEEENDAKRPHSTSTTPKSVQGTDLDEYDRVMGISSVHPSEGDRFDDGDLTDTEGMEEGDANDSENSNPIVSGLDNRPGADFDSRAYGSASLIECLNRNLIIEFLALPLLLLAPLREQLNTTGLSPTRDKLKGNLGIIQTTPLPASLKIPEADRKSGTGPTECLKFPGIFGKTN